MGAGKRRWSGWLYHNPDSGLELHDNHPIRSGECGDAERVRPATREALRDELLNAWRALADQEAEHAEMFREGNASRDRLAAELAAARAEAEAAQAETLILARRVLTWFDLGDDRSTFPPALMEDLSRAARIAGGPAHGR